MTLSDSSTQSMQPYEYTPLPDLCFNITVRNSAPWLDKCLESILSQKDTQWMCIVTDDSSNDETWSVIKKHERRGNGQIVAQRAGERSWKAKNFIDALTSLAPQDVVVELDGDDWLTHQYVVSELRSLHRKYDLVWTQHSINQDRFPNWHFWPSTPIPDDWTRCSPPRPAVWTKAFHPGHIRTFKRFLFDHIDIGDLTFEGDYLRTAFDAAYYTALLEMTHPHLRYFYDRECALYNVLEHNDTFTDKKHGVRDRSLSQSLVANQIGKRPVYERLWRPHLAVAVPTNERLAVSAKRFQRLARQHPNIILYVGILSGWDVTSYQQFKGVRFINLEQILRATELNGCHSLANQDNWAVSAFALYLLQNSYVEEFTVLHLDSFLRHVDDGSIASLIGQEADGVSAKFSRREIPNLRKTLRHEVCAGSPI